MEREREEAGEGGCRGGGVERGVKDKTASQVIVQTPSKSNTRDPPQTHDTLSAIPKSNRLSKLKVVT